MAEWYNHEGNLNICFVGGESRLKAQNRMFNVLENLLNEDFNVIGIASHGSAIRCLLMKIGKAPDKILNSDVFHIIYEDGNWIVEQL